MNDQQNTILRLFGKRKSRRIILLLCASLLMALFLLPREVTYRPPRQEYADNGIKNGRVIFSKPSGFYEDAFTLRIKAPTSDIYYTLDGTEPVRDAKGTFRYQGGIEITDTTLKENVHSRRTDVTTLFDRESVEQYNREDRLPYYRVPDDPVDKCTIVRAVFYAPGGERSEVQTGAYFIGYGGRKGYSGIKKISIVTNPANLFDYEKGIYVTGKAYDDFKAADSFHDGSIWYRHVWWWWDANYHNSGRDWERQANVQFFSEDGSLLLQQDAGIRIQGGGSRGFLPKSLNLYARRDYDGNTSFHYDFFGTGYQAKRLTLTSSGDDYYTKQKDRLVSELMEGQGFSVMHYEPCLLFLDGEFWGFYYLTEKYDEKYFSYYCKVPEEEVVEVKNSKIEVGNEEDLALYEEMKTFIEENDMSVPENYEKACELIDVDSFINYYAALIYCGRCGDWPNGNTALWRTREAAVQPSAESGNDGQEEGRSEERNSGSEDSGTLGSDTGAAMEETTQKNPAETAGSKKSASSYRDGRWRWILFDVNSAAISPHLQQHDTLKYVLNLKQIKMFASLCNNPGFLKKFESRILEYGETLYSPASVNEYLDRYAEEMAEPMELHFRRFFGEDSGLDFGKITDAEIRDFFEVRYTVVQEMLKEHFGGSQ